MCPSCLLPSFLPSSFSIQALPFLLFQPPPPDQWCSADISSDTAQDKAKPKEETPGTSISVVLGARLGLGLGLALLLRGRRSPVSTPCLHNPWRENTRWRGGGGTRRDCAVRRQKGEASHGMARHHEHDMIFLVLPFIESTSLYVLLQTLFLLAGAVAPLAPPAPPRLLRGRRGRNHHFHPPSVS